MAGADDARLVITTALEPCLAAYPMREWLEFEARLNKLPQFDPAVSNLRRIYVSGAIECEVDKLGRLLIPATLRSYAGLERDCVWAGMGSHIELWSKDRFDSLHASVLSDADNRLAMARRLAELGL